MTSIGTDNDRSRPPARDHWSLLSCSWSTSSALLSVRPQPRCSDWPGLRHFWASTTHAERYATLGVRSQHSDARPHRRTIRQGG